MPELTCRNVVAVSDVTCRLNLTAISQRLPNAEYVPEVYYALIYRPAEIKASLLVNSSGKLVFSGARSIDDCERGLEKLVADLNSLGFAATVGPITVQNMVFNGRFQKRISLSRLTSDRTFDVEYEPEQFPGAILRPQSLGGGTILLFASGAVVVVGCKTKARAVGIALEAEHWLDSLAAFS